MTAEEAKQALKEGNRVRSKRWAEDYNIGLVTVIMTSEGDVYSEKIFDSYNEDDWEIVE